MSPDSRTSTKEAVQNNMPMCEEAAHTTRKAENGNVAQRTAAPEFDKWGLPLKKHKITMPVGEVDTQAGKDAGIDQKEFNGYTGKDQSAAAADTLTGGMKVETTTEDHNSSDEESFTDARSTPIPATPIPNPKVVAETAEDHESAASLKLEETLEKAENHQPAPTSNDPKPREYIREIISPEHGTHDDEQELSEPSQEMSKPPDIDIAKVCAMEQSNNHNQSKVRTPNGHVRGQSSKGAGISEWSHQHSMQPDVGSPEPEVDEWQTMPAYAPFDMYDDDNRLIAKEAQLSDDEGDAYAGLGGAGKGYTRVQLDEDAQSATSLDENTQYLFKEVNGGTGAGQEEDEEQRDAVSQMQATKDLLTEGQRIAYVGMTRLILSEMIKQSESITTTKSTKKELQLAAEAMQMWGQKMMVRLYAHMEISTAEQIMIEQLAEHGVEPADLTPTLMQNARVKNPMAEQETSTNGLSSPRPESIGSTERSSRPSVSSRPSLSSPNVPKTPLTEDEVAAQPPPPYQEHDGDDLPEVRTPSQLPTTASLDIDLRWTVLCDLFLTLIADSVYDARSRVLLEKVGKNMEVDWLEICRFEKRVTDALEMQQAAEKENWNEDDHKENRRKMALKKRYMMMGLATVGGGLVIGLSAGLLAPLIGAGLAAGFTTIGVAGTSGFLAGAGGAAIITTGAATSGGIIAVRAANRRTGAVKTFEYRPLHNNKRVNLIVTVSGWMTGKVDDVRLPYSTVDPIMGDIYSVLWEPEMLTSMGDTINILATEALTQGLQQVLGSTILIGLMAALQLPVVLTKLAYLIDNPWTVSLDRANAAGLILADSLIDRNLGARPITFVGYSLGSRVIFSCLRELARKGSFGLVQNVYLFGSPIVAKKDEYIKARTVVAGRFVNGYAKNDWILGYLFRLTSGGISRVAGLAPVEDIPGIENVDVTEHVPGHMAYRTAMPRLLREVGWIVESDEFTEIEDPDPENHAKRQRELINEIEEARKEFEKKEKEGKGGGKFGWLSRKKKTVLEKKEWETYEEFKGDPEGSRRTEGTEGNNHGVLFDIDAIRAELASEQMEVRELKSTLPPMKLDLSSPTSTGPPSSLRQTKSYDQTTMLSASPLRPSPAHSPRGSISDTRPVVRSKGEEDEMSMTFDTSYQSPPRSMSNSFNHLPLRPSRSPSLSVSAYGPPLAEPTDKAATLQRPELKTSSTLPPTLPAVNLGHNAWADDDDEEFGREREMEMTFA